MLIHQQPTIERGVDIRDLQDGDTLPTPTEIRDLLRLSPKRQAEFHTFSSI
jgi:hypothetical protein